MGSPLGLWLKVAPFGIVRRFSFRLVSGFPFIVLARGKVPFARFRVSEICLVPFKFPVDQLSGAFVVKCFLRLFFHLKLKIYYFIAFTLGWCKITRLFVLYKSGSNLFGLETKKFPPTHPRGICGTQY